jgi:hypothetical protein
MVDLQILPCDVAPTYRAFPLITVVDEFSFDLAVESLGIFQLKRTHEVEHLLEEELVSKPERLSHVCRNSGAGIVVGPEFAWLVCIPSQFVFRHRFSKAIECGRKMLPT